MTVIEDLAPAPQVAVQPRGMSRREGWLRRLPLLPALIYTIVVTQIPFVVTLWYSFQSYFWNSTAPAHFTGLSNYKTVFTNAAFRASVLRTVIMTASSVIVAMILGIAFALLLDRKFFGRGIVRTMMIALVVGAIALGVAMAAWMAVSISKGLSKAVSVARSIADGDLTQDITASAATRSPTS